jgi:L-iditol 2-dehydrogenase
MSSVSTKMHALILEAPLTLSYREVEVPAVGQGEMLVRVESTTTCGTDLKAFKRGHPQIPMPGLFGHEYSGVVVESGADAPYPVGTPIMGVHSAPCQACFWCDRNQENLCESIMATKVLGSFAEYVLIPHRIGSRNVFEKPESISFDVASLLEPYACVAQALQEAQLQKWDQRVLVIGPGAIGLLFVAALKQLGVSEVVLAGRNINRLAVGEKYGARTSQYSSFIESDFDVVIECTGQVEVWEKSIEFARKGGKVILFGGCAPGTRSSFDTARLHYSQIQLISPFHFGTAAVQQARNWIIDAKVDLSLLISGERGLHEGKAIFEDLDAGKAIKYVIHPSQHSSVEHP